MEQRSPRTDTERQLSAARIQNEIHRNISIYKLSHIRDNLEKSFINTYKVKDKKKHWPVYLTSGMQQV